VARPRKAPRLLGEYLLELSANHHALRSYLDDPKKALADSGLTKAQQKILLSNDLEKIRDAIREEYGRAEIILCPVHIAASVHLVTGPERD
jgi:hypothetical protein